MRILGIDFGEKRVGLAVSDPLGFTAQGLETVANTGRQAVVRALAEVCRREAVTEVVIGLPVNMDGSIGPKAREVLDLVPKLEGAFGVPVKTWDERLSSRQVNRLMTESGLSSRKQRQQSDRLAATLILQAYLDSRRLDRPGAAR